MRTIRIDGISPSGSPGYLHFVPRIHWSTLEPETPFKDVVRLFKQVNFTYTNTESCNNRNECTEILQELQAQHIREGCADIKYNFMVSESGNVYEGRGWTFYGHQPSEVKLNEEIACMDIAFIGPYNAETGESPPFNMMAAALTLLKHGIQYEYIDPFFFSSYYPMPYNRKLQSMKQRTEPQLRQ